MNRATYTALFVLSSLISTTSPIPPYGTDQQQKIVTVKFTSEDAVIKICTAWIDFVHQNDPIAAAYAKEVLVRQLTVQLLPITPLTMDAFRNTLNRIVEEYCAQISGCRENADSSPSKKRNLTTVEPVDIETQALYTQLIETYSEHIEALSDELLKHADTHWMLINPAHPTMICCKPRWENFLNI